MLGMAHNAPPDEGRNVLRSGEDCQSQLTARPPATGCLRLPLIANLAAEPGTACQFRIFPVRNVRIHLKTLVAVYFLSILFFLNEDTLMASAASPPSAGQLGLGPALLAISLCMLFGANPVAVKITMTGFGVFATAALRFSIAAAVLTCWGLATGQRLRIGRRQLGQIAKVSLLFFLQIGLFYFGQNRTTATHGVLISNVMPFAVMVMAHYLLPDDRITPRKIAGLLLGFSGILILLQESLGLTASAFTGDMLLFVAVLFWACNAIYIKRIISGFTPLQITLYPMVLSIPLFVLTSLLLDAKAVHNLSAPALLGLGYQAIVTASFGFVMWNRLMQHYGATALHSFVFIMPISGVMLGVMLLGEPFTANLAGAILLVATGLLVMNWRRRSQAIPLDTCR